MKKRKHTAGEGGCRCSHISNATNLCLFHLLHVPDGRVSCVLGTGWATLDSSSVMGRRSTGQLSGVGPWAFASTPQCCHLRSGFSILVVQRLHGIVHSKSLVLRLCQGLSPLAQWTFGAWSLCKGPSWLLWGAEHLWPPIHSMPGEPFPSGDNHRCPQPLPSIPWGQNHLRVKTTELAGFIPNTYFPAFCLNESLRFPKQGC